MPAPRNRRHILVPGEPTSEAFTSRASGRAKHFRRPDDRVQHARRLTEALTSAQVELMRRRTAGILVSFESPPDIDLKLDSLENKVAGIEIRGVTRRQEQGGERFIETATVFIPEGMVAHFLGRFEQYATQNTRHGFPKHRDLVDRIAAIQLTTLRALWTDDPGAFPAEDALIWWEVWLRRTDDGQDREVDRLFALAREANLAVG